MAGEEPDPETRRHHLLPGRGSHHAQHAGLCALVHRDSGAAREEGQVKVCRRRAAVRTGQKQLTVCVSVSSGSVSRVLLFNATGERDAAAMLKLLVVSTWAGAVARWG